MKYLVTAVMILFTSQAQAFKPEIRGPGNASCAEFLKITAEGPQEAKQAKEIVVSWLEGIMTGVNMVSKGKGDKFAFLTTEKLSRELKPTCEDQPEMKLYEIAVAMIRKAMQK
jgi:hypothetical protein